jgi:hypothetical protein
MRFLVTAALLSLAMLTGCGASGSNPTKPRQVSFTAEAASGTPFELVGFQTSNGGVHRFDPPRFLAARYTFLLLNAVPPVNGTFAADPTAVEDVPIRMRDVDGTLLSEGTLVAHSTDQLTLSLPQNETPVPVSTPPPEIRVEVIAANDLQGVPFTVTIGDENSTILACGDSRTCFSPTMIYFENPQRTLSASIQKTINDNLALTVTLFLNDQPVDSALANQSDLSALVHVDL